MKKFIMLAFALTLFTLTAIAAPPMMDGRRIAPNPELLAYLCPDGYENLRVERISVHDVHSYISGITYYHSAGYKDYTVTYPLGGLLQNKIKLVKSVDCK